MTRRRIVLVATAVLLTGATCSASSAAQPAAAPATAPTVTAPADDRTRDAPAPLVGVVQQWDTQADLSVVLTAADLALLGEAGTRAVRVPVKCHVVGACRYEDRNDDRIDYRTVNTWDFAQLDRAVQHVLDQGMVPVIGLHPGDRMWRPGWIVDDAMWASTRAYVDRVAGHLSDRFGPLRYSLFETELNTSLTKVGRVDDAAYHHQVTTRFGQWPATLAALYDGDLAALNATWGTAHPSFASIPVPELGSVAGIPPGTHDHPATHDLRRVIGHLAARRYSALGALLHRHHRDNAFWGPTVQLPSFHDRRQVHTHTVLTPVGPTLSELAAQPGIDVLSVDGYRNDDPMLAAAEWQVAAKIAAAHGKRLAITEIGDTDAAGLARAADGVRLGGSNLEAVLVWQGRDRPGQSGFGLLDIEGRPKLDGRLGTVRRLFADLEADPGRGTYAVGDEAVYYPEWSAHVVQHGKLTFSKTLRLMADLFASGVRPEPALDSEIAAGVRWPRLSVFSLYVARETATVLDGSDQPVIGYQFAAHRAGFAAGRPVDLDVWRAKLDLRTTPAGWRPRAPEVVFLDDAPILVAAETSLAGGPFVRLFDPGPNPTYGRRHDGRPLGVRAADGSVWLDRYPGPAALDRIDG